MDGGSDRDTDKEGSVTDDSYRPRRPATSIRRRALQSANSSNVIEQPMNSSPGQTPRRSSSLFYHVFRPCAIFICNAKSMAISHRVVLTDSIRDAGIGSLIAIREDRSVAYRWIAPSEVPATLTSLRQKRTHPPQVSLIEHVPWRNFGSRVPLQCRIFCLEAQKVFSFDERVTANRVVIILNNSHFFFIFSHKKKV